MAIPGPRGGFLSVYVLAPVAGAVTGACVYEVLVGSALRAKCQENGMESVRLLLVGGFLGAGKTTLLYRAAKELMKSGKRVGLVTNDQAPELVDTQMLSANGLAVSEVAGSCFCCNFNGLVDAARSLCGGSEHVDLLLAEPVGSCTDLSATIVQPVKHRYSDVFSIGPLSVLIDPVRAMEVIGEKQSLLHPSAAYIYRKQLEEADRIVVNKSDLLDFGAREKLANLLRNNFPETKISFVSCKTGEGLSGWLTDVMNESESGERILDIDYDTYAEGEAVLGWLNARLRLSADKDVDWAGFAGRYLEAIQQQLRSQDAEVGHVKLFISAGGGNLTANLTAIDGGIVVHKSERALGGRQADMTFNARVQMDHEELERVSLEVLRESFGSISVKTERIRSLRPGRPCPTFRYSKKA
jgi:G3E family GTPase